MQRSNEKWGEFTPQDVEIVKKRDPVSGILSND